MLDLAPIPHDPIVADAIVHAAATYGLDPQFLRAVAYTESRYDPRAVSPAGAQGLFQIMPKTAAGLGLSDAFDPRGNALAGAKFLRQLDAHYHSWWRSLAAYNWGPTRVNAQPEWTQFPPMVRKYVTDIYQRAGWPVPLLQPRIGAIRVIKGTPPGVS